MVCFEVLGGGLDEFLEGFVFDVGGAPFGDDVAGEVAAELHGVRVRDIIVWSWIERSRGRRRFLSGN